MPNFRLQLWPNSLFLKFLKCWTCNFAQFQNMNKAKFFIFDISKVLKFYFCFFQALQLPEFGETSALEFVTEQLEPFDCALELLQLFQRKVIQSNCTVWFTFRWKTKLTGAERRLQVQFDWSDWSDTSTPTSAIWLIWLIWYIW